jgi:hypothetical protein
MRIAIFALLLSCALNAASVAGLQWTAPPGWTSKGTAPMRAATYAVTPDAECVVYYFGPGQGGSVEVNLDRWKGQFTQAGRPAQAQVKKRTVHGLGVTTIDTAGDYSGMGGPLASSPNVAHGYRLLGAIIEGPQGNIFIKFAGPAKSIAANQQSFEHLVDSFEPQRK